MKIQSALLLLIFCVPLSTWAMQDTLTIATVGSNPKKQYRYLKPMVDYMVTQMADLGIKKSRVLVAKDAQQMVGYLRQNKVDWVTETTIHALIFQQQANAQLLLRKWKKGVAEYHTVFFTRKDSGISRLQDLVGKVLAFEDPGSTTGYFIPAMTLLEAGFELEKLPSPRASPSADKIGYVFSRQEINLSAWVHKGLVDAGAYNNLDWQQQEATPRAFRKDMQLFYETENYPRAIELVRANLDPALIERLKMTLLNAHLDPKAAEVLKAYQKTARFDELSDDVLATLKRARHILQRVQHTLND